MCVSSNKGDTALERSERWLRRLPFQILQTHDSHCNQRVSGYAKNEARDRSSSDSSGRTIWQLGDGVIRSARTHLQGGGFWQ
uniref:Uncharacterized protein n=1 Tax=Picea sitchensis TaxID=3332 RepID=A9NND4_PICSI|nr:unknown [Picea sitchensis]